MPRTEQQVQAGEELRQAIREVIDRTNDHDGMTIEETGAFIEEMREQGWYTKLELFPDVGMPQDGARYRCTMIGPHKDDGTHTAQSDLLLAATIIQASSTIEQH